MRIAILGAGPAGLYLAYLIKRRGRTPTSPSSSRIRPTPPSASAWCSPTARSNSCARTTRRPTRRSRRSMESWDDMTLYMRGERVVIDGIGFAAIGRLQAAAIAAGARRVGRRRAGLPPRGDVARRTRRFRSRGRRRRRQFAGAPHASRESSAPASAICANRFAWFGTTKRFETLTQTFVHTERRRVQCASLPLRAGHEHLHRRDRTRRPSRAPASPRMATRNRRAHVASICSPKRSTAIR